MNKKNTLISNYNKLNSYLNFKSNLFEYANANFKDEKYLINHISNLLKVPSQEIIEKLNSI